MRSGCAGCTGCPLRPCRMFTESDEVDLTQERDRKERRRRSVTMAQMGSAAGRRMTIPKALKPPPELLPNLAWRGYLSHLQPAPESPGPESISLYLTAPAASRPHPPMPSILKLFPSRPQPPSPPRARLLLARRVESRRG